MRKLLLLYWIDIGLFLIAAAGFGSFYMHSISKDAVNGPIAVLESGHAIRRANGFLEGSVVPAGGNLYHLDFLWVPQDKSATLRFQDGHRLLLQEKTLLVLKVPFNPEREDDTPARLIRGSAIDLATNKKKDAPDFWSNLSEIPSDSSDKKDESAGERPMLQNIADNQIIPRNGVILYRNGPDTKSLEFIFPRKLSGTLILRELSTDTIEMIPVKDSSSVSHPITNSRRYRWQVVAGSGRAVLGPFEFEARTLTPERLKEVQQLTPEQQKKIQIEINGSGGESGTSR